MFSDEKQNFKVHYQKTICDVTDQTMVLSKTQELDRQKDDMIQRHAEELKKFDTDLILQIDQKVIDQQSTLEKAGVPGFHVTNNPLEIQVQMYMLDFINRLHEEKKKKRR